MKSVLLLTVLSIPITLQAQKIEIGLGGGVSINGKPSDNMPFKGNVITINYAANLSFVYNLNINWQTGLEIGVTELSRKSTDTFKTFFGVKFGNDDKRIVYAKRLPSAVIFFNRKFYGKNGYGYAGIGVGYGGVSHDSKNLWANESYRAPNGGNGLVLGVQAGYLKPISSSLAVFTQAAMRYYSLNYDAKEPLGTQVNLKYNIAAFPFTAGLRYIFMSGASSELEKQTLMRL
jgi:hypothetical protein